MPFAAIWAEVNIVSLWPVYPRGTDMTRQIDHITLDLRSDTSHCTRFDANGTRKHDRNKRWKLQPIDESPHSFWLPIFVKWETLSQQDRMFQRGFDAGTITNKDRVNQLFGAWADGIRHRIELPLPPTQTMAPDYVLCNFYTADGTATDLSFSGEMFKHDYAPGIVNGWVAGDVMPISTARFTRNGTAFTVAAACPGGTIEEPVIFGLPRSVKYLAGIDVYDRLWDNDE